MTLRNPKFDHGDSATHEEHWIGNLVLEQRVSSSTYDQTHNKMISGSIVQNVILGAVAHLQLGRALAKGTPEDFTRARQAYRDFLALWKDADPYIPILKQARVEYAKFQ